MKKKLFFFAVLMMYACMAFTQQREVTGKITGKDGAPIPFATVQIKGSNKGTTADVNGAFKLPIDANEAVLVITSVGYVQKEVTAAAGASFNISLDPAEKELEEVVVTALGIKREKKSLGYAVQEVKGDQLQHNKDNVVSALSGKVAGVQITNSSGMPGSSANIVIRGNQSISGSNSPLFVIDGIPMDNNVNSTESNLEGVQNSNRMIDLNPDDIETMSVLKGPAATALYGIGASNGAIVITTKKGSNTGGKMNISYSSSVTWSKVNKLPEFQSKFGQGINGQFHGPEDGVTRSWGADVSELRYYNNKTNPQDPLNPGNYLWSPYGAVVHKSNPHATSEQVRLYNNVEDFFRTGVTYDNALSLSGGNDRSTYRLSVSNQKNNGVVYNSDFRKTTLRLSADSKITDKLTSSATIAYINSGGTRIPQGGGISGIGIGLYRTPITFDNSNGATNAGDPKAYLLPDGQESHRAYTGVGPDGHTPTFDNPYWTVNKEQFKDEVNRVMGSATLSYDPFSWLNVAFRAGGDIYSDRRRQPYPKYSSTAPTGRHIEDQYLNRIINTDLLITFKKQFGKDFDFSFLYDNNLYSNYRENLRPTGTDLIFTDFEHITNAVNFTVQEGVFRFRRASHIGDLRLGYKNMLFLHASGRLDKSTTLPRNNNQFFYPSVDMGWVFSELGGLHNSGWLTFGKIRASYAKVGNDALPYSIYPNFVSTVFADGWTDGIRFPFTTRNGSLSGFMENGTGSGQVNNPNLKPESISQFETGIELRFLQDRIGVDVAYYSKKSTDQILAIPVSPASGYTSMVLNAGTIENKGVEVQLNIVPVKTRDFRWDLNINWSMNRSKVVELYPGVDQIGLNGYTNAVASVIKGSPYGAIFGFKYLRDNNGKLIIEDRPDAGEGNYGFPIPDISKSVALGDPNPDWIAGIGNTFSYKGFSLYALIDIKQGGEMWNGTRGALVSYGRAKETEARGTTTVYDGVQLTSGKTNDIKATLGQAWWNGNGGGFGPVAESFVEDAGYWRIREINLSYKFSPRFLSATKVIKGLELGVTGRNLWLHTKYTGVDPDGSLVGAGNGQGLDYFTAPGTKSYAVNLRLTL